MAATLRLRPALQEQLREAAYQLRVTQAQLVAEAVREKLERLQKTGDVQYGLYAWDDNGGVTKVPVSP
jgi:predicted transcriptional regulator